MTESFESYINSWYSQYGNLHIKFRTIIPPMLAKEYFDVLNGVFDEP